MANFYAYTVGSKKVEGGIDLRDIVPWVHTQDLWEGKVSFALLVPNRSVMVMHDGTVREVLLADEFQLFRAEGIRVLGRDIHIIDTAIKNLEHPQVFLYARGTPENPTAGIRGIIHIWTGGDSPWFFCYYFGRVGEREPFYLQQYKSAKVAVANIMADNR